MLGLTAEKQRAAPLQMQIDVALQINRPIEQISPGRHDNMSTAGSMAFLHRGANRRETIGYPVAFCSVGYDVKSALRKFWSVNAR